MTRAPVEALCNRNLLRLHRQQSEINILTDFSAAKLWLRSHKSVLVEAGGYVLARVFEKPGSREGLARQDRARTSPEAPRAAGDD